MAHTGKHLAHIAFSLVTALIAASCTSGSESEAAVSVETAATPSVADVSAEGRTAESLDDAPIETVNDTNVSPIFEALGFDPNDRQAAQAEYTKNAEELVRRCMADNGFDYTPNTPPVAPSIERQWELDAAIDQQTFTDDYGYGIATLLELDFFDEGVLAFTELVLGPPPATERTPSEQAAYEMALHGDTIQGLSAEDAQAQSADQLAGLAEPGSCRQVGYDNAEDPLGDRFDGLFTLLGDEYSQLYARVANDPRIRELTAAWQTCMAEFGHSYENRDEVFLELQTEADALRSGFQSSPEALAIYQAAIDADLATMDAADRYEFLDDAGAFQGFALVPSLQAELDQLIERELLLAANDRDCTDRAAIDAVVREYEQGFVDDHAAQLELLAAGEN